jgi:hypothetical protein
MDARCSSRGLDRATNLFVRVPTYATLLELDSRSSVQVPYQMRMPISVRICGCSAADNVSFSRGAECDAEASNLISPNRCRPSLRAPEIAVTRTASSTNEPSWPSSKSITAACKLAIEPQKRDTPSWRQRKLSDLQVLERKSDALNSSTRRAKDVEVQPSRDGVG